MANPSRVGIDWTSRTRPDRVTGSELGRNPIHRSRSPDQCNSHFRRGYGDHVEQARYGQLRRSLPRRGGWARQGHSIPAPAPPSGISASGATPRYVIVGKYAAPQLGRSRTTLILSPSEYPSMLGEGNAPAYAFLGYALAIRRRRQALTFHASWAILS